MFGLIRMRLTHLKKVIEWDEDAAMDAWSHEER